VSNEKDFEGQWDWDCQAEQAWTTANGRQSKEGDRGQQKKTNCIRFCTEKQMAKDSAKKKCPMSDKSVLSRQVRLSIVIVRHFYVRVVMVLTKVVPALKQRTRSLHKRRNKRGV
jgi:hypothetical protein